MKILKVEEKEDLGGEDIKFYKLCKINICYYNFYEIDYINFN